MPAKPNFVHVQLVDGRLRVEGTSDPDISDIIDIRVVLVQGGRMASGSVDPISSSWNIEFPASNASGVFSAGDAVAFGVETRSENLLTMTWTQPVEIR